MSAHKDVVAASWDGGLLRRPTNNVRRGHPRQGLGGASGSSGEVLGAQAASCGGRGNVGDRDRRNNAAGEVRSSMWSSSATAKCWVLLSVSAITAFVVLQRLVSLGDPMATSVDILGGRGVHHNDRITNAHRHQHQHQGRPSFSADRSALEEVVIIGGHHNEVQAYSIHTCIYNVCMYDRTTGSHLWL